MVQMGLMTALNLADLKSVVALMVEGACAIKVLCG